MQKLFNKYTKRSIHNLGLSLFLVGNGNFLYSKIIRHSTLKNMYDTNLTKVFETALGIHAPWTIDNTEFISNDKRFGQFELHVYIIYKGI